MTLHTMTSALEPSSNSHTLVLLPSDSEVESKNEIQSSTLTPSDSSTNNLVLELQRKPRYNDLSPIIHRS